MQISRQELLPRPPREYPISRVDAQDRTAHPTAGTENYRAREGVTAPGRTVPLAQRYGLRLRARTRLGQMRPRRQFARLTSTVKVVCCPLWDERVRESR